MKHLDNANHKVLKICRLVDALTVESEDNGYEFTNHRRRNLIIEELDACKDYELWAEMNLSIIYRHNDFDETLPFSIISCHIDSIYDHYYSDTPKEELFNGQEMQVFSMESKTAKKDFQASSDDNEICGTYDNSVCNAILLDSLLNGGLPAQVLVSFTGDEEEGGKGADQTIEIIKEKKLKKLLQFVCVMDITEESYRKHSLTIENIFINKKKRVIKNFPMSVFDKKSDLPVFEEADPDESWQYDENNCNCFSFCLPCRVIGDDMHDDDGVAIKLESIYLYQKHIECWFLRWTQTIQLYSN
jgi:hypothetical protein